MDIPNDCYVSGALAAVLRVSRLAGIAPLRFVKKDSGWRISVSTYSTLYGYIAITSFNICIIGIVCVFLQRDINDQRLSVRVVVSVINASMIILITGTLAHTAPQQMGSVIACLNQVQKINGDLNIPYKPIFSARKKFIVVILFMILIFFMNLADYVLQLLQIINMGNTQVETPMYVLLLAYHCCNSIIELRKMQFVAVTMHVMETYRAINDGLRNLLHGDQKPPLILPFHKSCKKYKKKRFFDNNVSCFPNFKVTISDVVPKTIHPQHEVVRRLARGFSSTCDVVRELDQSNGLVLLLMLGHMLYQLVLSPYFFITSILDGNIPSNIYLYPVMLPLFWCIYYTASLLAVIEPCHLTQMEVETTHQLVSHLIQATPPFYYQLEMELQLFFRLLVLNQASYSAFQVTTLSRSLVLTMLGSVTTYLVILIEP